MTVSTFNSSKDKSSFEPKHTPGKRVLDLVLSVPAFLFLIPIFIFIAIAIKLDDGGPVFFRHKRRGMNGKTFGCLKFRSMVVDAERRLEEILANDPDLAQEWRDTQKLRDDPRVTGIGGFLRRTSLDELPQLLNIVRGEMSVVGPRPIVEDEVVRYGEKIAFYDSVRPGVLGLWQVSGRSDTSYEERVDLDVEYALEQSSWKDISIILKAVPAVLLSRGAY